MAGVANSRQRRDELMTAFGNAVEYANNNGIDVFLIAGDLFDSDYVAAATVNNVNTLLSKYPHINYYILRGNHNFSSAYDKIQLANVHFFDAGQWTTYFSGDITITGTELMPEGTTIWQDFPTPSGKYNIVLLHGELNDDKYGHIDANKLADAGVNYVALGHRHSYSAKKLKNTTFAYSGTLETRGFDENTDTGFVVGDSDLGKLTFIKQAIRRVANVTMDVSGAASEMQLLDIVNRQLNAVHRGDYLNLTLVGVSCDGINVSRIEEALQGVFFALRVTDNTTAAIDEQRLTGEISLAGEFFRTAAARTMDDKLRRDVLTLGLKALKGEKVEL
jgi:DNA repair exonuclease SbcCD nuclease subunit